MTIERRTITSNLYYKGSAPASKPMPDKAVNKDLPDPKTMDFGLHFKPWHEISKVLPKSPAGYHWEMSFHRKPFNGSYIDYDYKTMRVADREAYQDNVIKVELIGPIKSTAHIANLTGEDNRTVYRDNFLKEYRQYPTIAQRNVFNEVVGKTRDWAREVIDEIAVRHLAAMGVQSAKERIE